MRIRRDGIVSQTTAVCKPSPHAPVVDRPSSFNSFSSALSSDDSFYDDSCPYLCLGRHFAATHALVEPCALRGFASRSDQDPFYTGRRGATLCRHAWKAAFCVHNSRASALRSRGLYAFFGRVASAHFGSWHSQLLAITS